jgi:predicted O-methyltransferase YrrM
MASKTSFIAAPVVRYMVEHSVRDTPLLAELRERTAREPMARMQVPADEGQLLAFLVELTGATRCLEIGTFTGYSSLCIAQALPTGGQLVCLDRSAEYTAVAREFWRRARVADRIELVLGPALESLARLRAERGPDAFDLAFIDADKQNHVHYYEHCLALVRPGGLIVVDNTLWSGAVADPADQEPDTVAIRALNELVHRDERVTQVMLTVADGITLVRRRS